jgi:hypothetical protein
MCFHDLKKPLPPNYVVQCWLGDGFWNDVNAREIIDKMSNEWAGMGAVDGLTDEVFIGKRAYSVDDPNRRFFLLVFSRVSGFSLGLHQ